MSRVSACEGDIAEQSIVTQWQSLLEQLGPGAREILPKNAPVTFWNEQSFPVFFAAEKTTLDASSMSVDSILPSSTDFSARTVLQSNVALSVSNSPLNVLQPEHNTLIQGSIFSQESAQSVLGACTSFGCAGC